MIAALLVVHSYQMFLHFEKAHFFILSVHFHNRALGHVKCHLTWYWHCSSSVERIFPLRLKINLVDLIPGLFPPQQRSPSGLACRVLYPIPAYLVTSDNSSMAFCVVGYVCLKGTHKHCKGYYNPIHPQSFKGKWLRYARHYELYTSSCTNCESEICKNSTRHKSNMECSHSLHHCGSHKFNRIIHQTDSLY